MKSKQVVRRLFRFSLAGLFFVMTCVAGYFAGFRVGKENGEHERYLVSEISKSYSVGDVLRSGLQDETQNAISLAEKRFVKLITSTIHSSQWEQNGGKYTIDALPRTIGDTDGTDHQFSIFASGEIHDKIEQLLENLRSISAEIKTEEVVPGIQKAIATQDSVHTRLLRCYIKQSVFAKERLPRQFHATVKKLQSLWGKPSFIGSCTEASFPKWSSAQEIATWPKNGGFAYLQIHDVVLDDSNKNTIEHLGISCGWRPDEDSTKLIVEYQWSPTAQIPSYQKESNDEN